MHIFQRRCNILDRDSLPEYRHRKWHIIFHNNHHGYSQKLRWTYIPSRQQLLLIPVNIQLPRELHDIHLHSPNGLLRCDSNIRAFHSCITEYLRIRVHTKQDSQQLQHRRKNLIILPSLLRCQSSLRLISWTRHKRSWMLVLPCNHTRSNCDEITVSVNTRW